MISSWRQFLFRADLSLLGTPKAGARRSDSMSATPDPGTPTGQMKLLPLGSKRKFKAPGLTTVASKPEHPVAEGEPLACPAANKPQAVPANAQAAPSLAAAAVPVACQYFTCLYTKRAPQKVWLHCSCNAHAEAQAAQDLPRCHARCRSARTKPFRMVRASAAAALAATSSQMMF